MTHVPEIVTESPYQKVGTINWHEDRALSSYLLPETGTGKIRYQTACQMRRKPVPVFGADFWYVCHWHYISQRILQGVICGRVLRLFVCVFVSIVMNLPVQIGSGYRSSCLFILGRNLAKIHIVGAKNAAKY